MITVAAISLAPGTFLAVVIVSALAATISTTMRFGTH